VGDSHLLLGLFSNAIAPPLLLQLTQKNHSL